MQKALSKELRITGGVTISGQKSFICISHIILCKYNYFYLIQWSSFQYIFIENLYITSTVQELGVQKWIWHPFTSRTSQFGGETDNKKVILIFLLDKGLKRELWIPRTGELSQAWNFREGFLNIFPPGFVRLSVPTI